MNKSAHPISPRFEDALTYAIDQHRGDVRKGTGAPYLAHILAVTAIALEMECTEDEAIAALLHDVVEDHGGPKAEAVIRERFGDQVADMVVANSDTDEDPKPPWKQRKVDYIDGVATKPIGAVRVSIADKLHNARSILLDHRRIGDELWGRFSVSDPAEITWYYRSLVKAFGGRRDELGDGAVAALEELDRTVTEIEARVERRRNEKLDRLRDAYLTEGGTARYPEGTRHRGHDVNALLDKMDEREGRGSSDATDPDPPSGSAAGP